MDGQLAAGWKEPLVYVLDEHADIPVDYGRYDTVPWPLGFLREGDAGGDG